MFVITGGGTGGHLAIAKALALELKAQQIPCIYIGSLSGQDRQWFEKSDVFTQTHFLDSTGVVNKRGLGKLKAIYKTYQAVRECRGIFKTHNIKAVISVGGFSAAGASVAAISKAIPLFIHEQNAVSGTLNSVLFPFARAIFGSFDLPSAKFVACDYPVREEFFTKARTRSTIKHILFLGGSQGALAINDLALELASMLIKQGFGITHQCGERDFERVSKQYENLGLLDSINLFAFSPNIVEALCQADVCVGRAGASSVWESCANGLPCFFIPYPYAHKNHQYLNARALADDGLCGLCPQVELSTKKVLEFIDSLKNGSISNISSTLQGKIAPNGAREIISHIKDLTS